MTKSEKLLSICILSYNQAEEIERLLKSIEPQVVPEVEIVIRDDSVNDETEKLVEQFSKRFLIRYLRGEKGGIDRTIIYLTNEARGEFIWWVGDDEIAPGGIKMVLDTIKNHPDTTFIWANPWAESYGLSVDFPESRFFKNRDEVLETITTGLGFISSTVIKKDIALQSVGASEKYIGSEFVNLYITLYVLSRPGQYYYFRGPAVINHPATNEEIRERVVRDGKIKNRAFEVFGVNFAKIVCEFKGSFSKGAVRRTIKKSFGQTWRGMLVGWVGGWDTPKGKRWKMLKLYWSYPECWVALPLMLLPLWLNKFLYRIYKVFFSHRKWRFGKRA